MSDRELKELIASLAQEHKKTELAQQKTELAQQKTQAALESLAQEHKKTEAAQQKTELAQQKTELAQQKTELAQQKTQAALLSFQENMEAGMRELRKELSGVGRTQGEIAEDLFRRNLMKTLAYRGILLDRLEHNWRLPETEFDLIGINGEQIVLVEVKSRLNSRDIERLIDKQIPIFRKRFDEFRGHKLIGSVASLAMSKRLERQAQEEGLFVFTQTEDGGASLLNPENFKPRFF